MANDNEDEPEDLIRYDVLTQDALKEVIRRVLTEVSSSGLPGEHHFFITFRTDHPGVRLSARMKERYEEEMTIVIQHSFWDLNVNEQYFEIDLSFDDIMERLRIPFASLKGFFDPYVKFGVQFDATFLEPANEDIEDSSSGEDDSNLPQVAENRDMVKAEKPKAKSKKSKAKSKEQDAKDDEENDDDTPPSQGADVVSLDSFRKKN